MHANNRRVDHLHGSIMSIGQRAHELGPHAGPSPANEPIVASRVRTEVFWQVAPWCSGAQHPEETIEDTTVIHSGTPRGLFGSIGLMANHSLSVSS